MTMRDEFEKDIPIGFLSYWDESRQKYMLTGRDGIESAITNLQFAAYQSAHAKQQKRIDELECLLVEAADAISNLGYGSIDACTNAHKALTATAQEGKNGS